MLKTAVPESISKNIRWETLRPSDKEFVEELFVGSESDILFEVEVKNGKGKAYIYILLEHQSEPDKWMAFRALKYSCRIWDLTFKLNPKQKRLCPIIPIIYYQGKRRWRYPTQFLALFENPRPWRKILPRYSFLLLDQSGSQEYSFLGTVKARIAQLLLWSAYHGEVRRILEILAEMLPLLEDSGGGLDYFQLFILYALETQDELTLYELKKSLKSRKGESNMRTLAERIREEGRKEGIEEGIEKVAKNLLSEGIDLEIVLKNTGLTEDYLRKAGIL